MSAERGPFGRGPERRGPKLWTRSLADVGVWTNAVYGDDVSTRIDCVVVDANDPATMAHFWSAVTGWPVTSRDADPMVAPGEVTVGPALRFVLVPEKKPSVKNRLHLDLSSASASAQAATVQRLVGLGAEPVDLGQGDVPWVVLGDPEGNEFCVLEPRDAYRDCGPIAALVVDAVDPRAQAGFWSVAAGWPIVQAKERFAALRTGSSGSYVEFMRTDHPKTTRNRLHVGLTPNPGDDLSAEITRLVQLGAQRIEVGQEPADRAPAGGVVLADPEGNEFVALTPR